MNALVEQAQKAHVPYGEARVWWLSQMGLLIKLGETLLCVDYYASDDPARTVPPPIPVREVAGIDVFLGTHDHSDHIDHPSWALWAKTCPDARFVFPAVHRSAVLADGVKPQNCFGLNDGQSVRLGNVTIRALAAAHEFLDRDEQSGLYPCLQYVIEGNGVRLYHAGDTLRYEGMLPKLCGFGPIDLALLPINGRDAERYRRNCIGNMTFQEAADLAGELQMRAVIAGHWDLFANNSADPAQFRDYLQAKYGQSPRCVVPKLGEEIRIPIAD
ncbi:MAG: MBL fold metallo-hydrolase [Clostridia bacterium]|nr:MBL fold metallo-hydrolase [Clostridia bacterium]